MNDTYGLVFEPDAKGMDRVPCTFIRQKEKPRLETRRWNHVRDIMQIGVGTADIFLEMIMQPFLGFVCIVPGSYNLVIV